MWRAIPLRAPNSTVIYSVAELGTADFAGLAALRVVSLAPGGIVGSSNGLLTGLWSGGDVELEELARMLGWIRWIRPIERRLIREHVRSADAPGLAALVSPQTVLGLAVRHNHKTAQKQDAAFALRPEDAEPQPLREALASGRTELSVVELFGGAGGMGLGFLLAGAGGEGPRYRVIYSGEVNPIYARTLEINHRYLHERGVFPADHAPARVEAVDHRDPDALRSAKWAAGEAGGVDVLIGGPPCQGFSTANRNSWSSSNPNNLLVDTFLDYVVALRPRALLMENVQGILWTPRPGDGLEGELSVVGHVARRLGEAGYQIYPKLLDAAWYGVPQFRNRFFLLGLHEDLGYAEGAFDSWGPFPPRTHGPGTPRPYTTVGEALGDLPPIGNGENREQMPYNAPAEPPFFLKKIRRWAEDATITDHVTSRHAAYVIARYEQIREGGNWTDIAHMMSNYADIERTHSNIYRRLVRSEPSITIGHYRKSMLVHPTQHRGLSLREAARLQSFPDWFRFAGTIDGKPGGISHKQQQVANAVCPLLSEAVARYLLAI
jgi:DNA-cytosine methyltransferase